MCDLDALSIISICEGRLLKDLIVEEAGEYLMGRPRAELIIKVAIIGLGSLHFAF